jgi:hypothetical protein
MDTDGHEIGKQFKTTSAKGPTDLLAPARRGLSAQPIYVARIPAAPLKTRSLPALTRCYPRSFAFYVAVTPITGYLKND